MLADWYRNTSHKKKMIQFTLLVLHFALLKWILFLLSHAGEMKTEAVFAHFTGLSICGAGLIRICAYLGKQDFLREQRSSDGMEAKL